jgi:hypothetical protein
MAINAQNRSLPDWFTRVRTRQVVLPRFQRFEAWGHANVAQLFNTILRGLPVGAVLVLEIGNDEPFISRTLKGAPETGERITEHLLDGQQRLTALWRGLNNNYEDRTYFLFLEPDEETGMPYYVDSVARWSKGPGKEIMPAWANKPSAQWARRAIPLDLCAPGESGPQRFRDWAKGAIADRDERDHISDQMSLIRGLFAAFNLPFLSLPASTQKETALDVFIKMNTSAAPLSTYDVVVAQVEAAMGKSLHDLVADTREACPHIADYYPPEDLALYASALLQGKAAINASYMAKEFGPQLLSNWDTLIGGLSRTVAFLEEERVFDAQRLPTDVVVPVLVALWAIAPDRLDGEGRARTILRKYLWRAFFSTRYEKATSTRALVDFSEIRSLILDPAAPTPTIFDLEQYPLPQPQELIAAGWPKKKDRLARATLALALRAGGLDLADGTTVTRANLAKREYHHLFPVARLEEVGMSDDQIFRAMNCAVVTWHTNRNISAKHPERYLAERREGTELGESEVRTRLASHLIPYDQLISGGYDAFLTARASLIATAMSKVCASGASELIS